MQCSQVLVVPLLRCFSHILGYHFAATLMSYAPPPRVGTEGGEGTAHRIARNSKTAARARANVALMSRKCRCAYMHLSPPRLLQITRTRSPGSLC